MGARGEPCGKLGCAGRGETGARRALLGRTEARGYGCPPRFLKKGGKRLGHFAGRLEPPLGLLGHHLGHQGRQLGGDLGPDEVERPGVHRMVGLEDVVERLGRERRAAAQQVVKRAAQAVDVGPDIGRLGVVDLLGRDEVGRAEHLTGRGSDRSLPRCVLAVIHCQLDDLVLEAGLGQAEVEDLDDRPVAVAREHEVARLDIAVNHALLVGVLEPQGGLLNVVAGVANRHRPAGLDHPGQVQALDVLHGEDEVSPLRNAV